MTLEYLGEWEMLQDDYNVADECPVCGAFMEWEECYAGCDDGYFDMYDEDPFWYDEDDVEVCDVCHGNGGYWTCHLAHTHPASDEVLP